MDYVPYVIAALSALITLAVRYVAIRVTHGGNVRMSDADTIFKASESIRNDLADELKECRKDRDRCYVQLQDCLERRGHA